MKRYLLLLSIVAIFTSCKEDIVEQVQPLRTGAHVWTDVKITNKEEILKGHILPGDTINLSINIVANTNGVATIDTIRIWPEELFDDNYVDIDTVDVEEVMAMFALTIPINHSFEGDLDSTLNLQFIVPEFTVNRISSPNVTIEWPLELTYSDAEGGYVKRDYIIIGREYRLILLGTENFEYTFKLYNNYVGKPFDDPNGLGFNLYTQQYLNTPCVLDGSCVEGTDYDVSKYLELPTICNMSYLPEANPEGKFFVPAFGNLQRFLSGIERATNFNLERLYFYNSPGDWGNYQEIVTEVEIGDVFRNANKSIVYNIEGLGEYHTTYYLKVLDIVEAGEESYVEFLVSMRPSSMYIFNAYHGL